MTRVALLMPTRGRADRLFDNVSHLLAQHYPEDVWLQIVMAVPANDIDTIEATIGLRRLRKNPRAEAVRILRKPESTAVDGWNLAYAFGYKTGADWFILGADDISFKDGWLDEALKVADETGAHVIGLNDGDHTDLNHYAPHYMVTRDFTLNHLGEYMVPPMYNAWWFDREVCEKAQSLGVYAQAPMAVADHLHPNWGTAQNDATYQMGAAYHGVDQHHYERRRDERFPIDYKPGLTSYEV
jgi:hypothetical protein